MREERPFIIKSIIIILIIQLLLIEKKTIDRPSPTIIVSKYTIDIITSTDDTAQRIYPELRSFLQVTTWGRKSWTFGHLLLQGRIFQIFLDFCSMLDFIRFRSAFYGDKNRINAGKSRLWEQFPAILDDLVTRRVAARGGGRQVLVSDSLSEKRHDTGRCRQIWRPMGSSRWPKIFSFHKTLEKVRQMSFRRRARKNLNFWWKIDAKMDGLNLQNHCFSLGTTCFSLFGLS